MASRRSRPRRAPAGRFCGQAGSPGPGACRKKRSDGESSAQRSAPRRIRGGDALPGGQTPPNRGPATDRPAVLSPCRCRPACSSGRPRTGLRGLAPRSLFLSVPLSRPRVPSCLHRYSRPTIAPPSPFHGPLSSARGHTRQQLLRQSDLDAGPHARLGCTHYTSRVLALVPVIARTAVPSAKVQARAPQLRSITVPTWRR